VSFLRSNLAGEATNLSAEMTSGFSLTNSSFPTIIVWRIIEKPMIREITVPNVVWNYSLLRYRRPMATPNRSIDDQSIQEED